MTSEERKQNKHGMPKCYCEILRKTIRIALPLSVVRIIVLIVCGME